MKKKELLTNYELYGYYFGEKIIDDVNTRSLVSYLQYLKKVYKKSYQDIRKHYDF